VGAKGEVIEVMLQIDWDSVIAQLDSTRDVASAIRIFLGLPPSVSFSVWFGGEPVDVELSCLEQDIGSGARLSVIVNEETWRDHYQAARIKNRKIPLGRSAELGLTDASFTIEAWVKVNKLSTKTGDAWYDDNAIFGTAQYGNGSGLHCIIRDHCARFDFYCNGMAGMTPIPLREWSHVAFVYNMEDQSQSIIVNGELDVHSCGHSPLKGNVPLDIGSWAGGRYLDGDIAEFRVWNVARSAVEVREAMHKPYAGLNDKAGLRTALSFIGDNQAILDHVAASETPCPTEVVGLESPFRGT